MTSTEPSAGHTGAFAGTPAGAFGIGYRSGDQGYLDLTATAFSLSDPAQPPAPPVIHK
jgi:hypothetical protein